MTNTDPDERRARHELMNDLIRGAVGRGKPAPGQPPPEEDTAGGMGGGVHSAQTPVEAPSVNALIRAQVEARRAGVQWLAHQIDDERRLRLRGEG
jgi:hypothetical protein